MPGDSETVRIHRGDADPVKGARNSGLHLPCHRLCLYTGSKAARSFLGPALCPAMAHRCSLCSLVILCLGAHSWCCPAEEGSARRNVAPGAGNAVSWGLTSGESRAEGSGSQTGIPGVSF